MHVFLLPARGEQADSRESRRRRVSTIFLPSTVRKCCLRSRQRSSLTMKPCRSTQHNISNHLAATHRRAEGAAAADCCPVKNSCCLIPRQRRAIQIALVAERRTGHNTHNYHQAKPQPCAAPWRAVRGRKRMARGRRGLWRQQQQARQAASWLVAKTRPYDCFAKLLTGRSRIPGQNSQGRHEIGRPVFSPNSIESEKLNRAAN